MALTLYILHPGKTFDDLALALTPHPLDLIDVRPCTFPSRPEPRQATWVTQAEARRLLVFDYVPDLHLRTLLLLDALAPALGLAHTHLTLPDLLVLQQVGARDDEMPWFDLWSDLHEALHRPDHLPAQRAATAWRMRGEAEPSSITRSLCANILQEGLLRGSVSARRACAEQMHKWPKPEHLEALRKARDEDEDVEVRVHAQRAIDQILTQMR